MSLDELFTRTWDVEFFVVYGCSDLYKYDPQTGRVWRCVVLYGDLVNGFIPKWCILSQLYAGYAMAMRIATVRRKPKTVNKNLKYEL